MTQQQWAAGVESNPPSSHPELLARVFGDDQAAQTLLSIQLSKRTDVSEEEKKAHLADIKARYDATLDPRYAAARLWVDGILDPRDTREVVSACLEACAHEGEQQPFRWGVLQT